MGWTLVLTLFLGIYGSLIHPVVGVVGFFAPFLIKIGLDRGREKAAAALCEWRARDEEEHSRQRAMRLSALQNRLRERLNEKINDTIFTFRTMVTSSPMGLRDYRRFDQEIVSFLEAGLTEGDMVALLDTATSLRDLYDAEIKEELHANLEESLTARFSVNPAFLDGSPLAFEQHCAKIFRTCGWSVKTTPVSGDHGVDLVASRNGKTIAVQCKLYHNPVGNSAVQEVAAGRMHYGADAAVVVAINGYTKGAEALARSNGVELIHPDDILSLFGAPANSSAETQASGRRFDWPPRGPQLKK